jgi:hypothetical protein
MRRSLVLAVVLILALCAPASAQAPPAELWESGPAAGGATGSDGRSALLFALALVAFAGAGGVAVLAVRTPRAPGGPRSIRPAGVGGHPAPIAVAADEPGPRERIWHPRVSGGPPPLPAFGPGSQAGPSAAPPPPD